MVLLDTTVLSVAEPDLARSLGGSLAGLQWAMTGYTVVFGALLLSAGALADRYGAHRVLRAGVAVFGLASLLCVFAPGLGVLVALRALLGAAAAATVPASMVIIGRLYPEPARRARAVATWAALSGTAMAAGPVAGGLLVELAGWRGVFLINVPLAAVTLALVAGRAAHCPPGERAIDWPAQLAAGVALALGTDAIIALGSGAAGHAAGSAAAALAAGAGFALLERRSASPVLPSAVLRARGMPPALLAGAAVNFSLAATLFVLPLILGRDPLETGLAFLPLTLPIVVNPLLTGRIVARVGPRAPVAAGLALLAAGVAVLGAAALAGWPYALWVPGLLATGFGVSSALPALVTMVVARSPEGGGGAAGGLLNAVRQVGATLGVAIVGAFPAHGHALLLAAALCAAAGAAVLARR
ncbi:MFS transporter [Bailinhaonella thermotolerans]|uniref:MFS transporter n=2 Tax=Bailinhaonella thermotolerans TaxID=1070861 RepID=A0A3A4B6T2_9ACTN|nr:MFS transporter [Bailinhaonella thermotolerans]